MQCVEALLRALLLLRDGVEAVPPSYLSYDRVLSLLLSLLQHRSMLPGVEPTSFSCPFPHKLAVEQVELASQLLADVVIRLSKVTAVFDNDGKLSQEGYADCDAAKLSFYPERHAACSLFLVVLNTPQVIVSSLSALVEHASTSSTQKLLTAALNSFLSMLLRSARPNTGRSEIAASDLSVVVERITKESPASSDDYIISEEARQLFKGGIVEISLLRFLSSPHRLLQNRRG